MNCAYIRAASSRQQHGFTLVELMIVVAIIAILAAISVPAYNAYAVKTKRKAAEACLSNLANYMERYYTTNLRYDQNSGGTANSLPALACTTDSDMSTYYLFSFAASQPTQSTYTIRAVPQGGQANNDAACGTLTIDHLGARGVSGSNSVDQCW